MTAKASLAGKQPLPHLSPCCLFAEAPACLVVAGREEESVCPFKGSLIPGAAALDGFFFYLAYGNCLLLPENFNKVEGSRSLQPSLQ